jgi:hypothetical protein
MHVGNCRCYLQRDTTLEQLTIDHTLAQQLVDSGVLPAHEGATSWLSTGPWKALSGGFEDLRPEANKARLQVGDTLLLCTDGLPTYVPDSTIRALLQAQAPARETCRRLVEAATRAGGTDNITVIVRACGTRSPARLRLTATPRDSCGERHHAQRPSGSATVQRQQVQSGELRAEMCLTRAWRAPIYDWFTEGVDTADQQEAKALLKELSFP